MSLSFSYPSFLLCQCLLVATRVYYLQVLIAANLEPEGARSMLPCFDSPRFKANFSMNLQAPSDLIALSNTPEYRSQPGLEPGTTLHVFETTPKMATYLIGVTVGHMVSTSATSDSGRNISYQSTLCRLWVINMLFHCRHDFVLPSCCCILRLQPCNAPLLVCRNLHVTSLHLHLVTRSLSAARWAHYV